MLHPGGTEVSVTRSLWASGLKGQQPRDRKQLTRASLSVAGWAVLGASVSRGPHALACQTQEGHQIQEVFSLCPQRCMGLSRRGVRPQGQPWQPKKASWGSRGCGQAHRLRKPWVPRRHSPQHTSRAQEQAGQGWHQDGLRGRGGSASRQGSKVQKPTRARQVWSTGGTRPGESFWARQQAETPTWEPRKERQWPWSRVLGAAPGSWQPSHSVPATCSHPEPSARHCHTKRSQKPRL